MYDPAVARFTTQDRFSEKYYSLNLYHYVGNNPINVIDINGDSTFVVANDDGTYRVVGGNLEGDDRGIYVQDSDGNFTGESIGNSITTHSFFNSEGDAVVGAVIDLNSRDGQNFLDDEIIQPRIGLMEYMSNATGGEDLDFKNRGITKSMNSNEREQHRYRGSVNENGEIGSARDYGNIGAGIVAARHGMSFPTARLGFDGLQTLQQSPHVVYVPGLNDAVLHYPWREEPSVTQKAQKVGIQIGNRLNKIDERIKEIDKLLNGLQN